MIGKSVDDPPRVIFQRNPLKAVIAQVRYQPIYSLAQPSGIAPFQDAIRDGYPLSEAVVEASFSIGPNAPAISLPSGPTWRFSTEDRNWIVGVGPESLTLETPAYPRFEPFRDRFASVLHAAIETLHLNRRERFGLRYINQVIHPAATRLSEWPQFLSDRILGFALDDVFDNQAVTSFQQIQVNLPNGKATVRHGFIPQPAGELPYVIDLDVYDDQPKVLNSEQVVELMTSYKRWVWRFFRSIINERLYEYLGPTEIPEEGRS